MTTKRIPIRRDRRARLTPETVALWIVLREIEDDPDGKEWEPEGRYREYLDGTNELCRRLGLWWGHSNPLDATTAEPPDWMAHNELQADAWREAYRWRCLLIEAEADYDRNEQAKGIQLTR
jgi:hypothetical protein